MRARTGRRARFRLALALALLLPDTAHAQRIPEIALWSAGASLFAPFVAVPVKLGILRLRSLEARSSHLWQISGIEWLLWFPAAFILLRSGRSSSVPWTVLALLGLVVWLHGLRLPDTRWSSALLLSLPTPILALALPFLALVVIAWLEPLVA